MANKNPGLRNVMNGMKSKSYGKKTKVNVEEKIKFISVQKSTNICSKPLKSIAFRLFFQNFGHISSIKFTFPNLKIFVSIFIFSGFLGRRRSHSHAATTQSRSTAWLLKISIFDSMISDGNFAIFDRFSKQNGPKLYFSN